MTTVRIATRGSDLALQQARGVAADLAERRYDPELVEVETEGDRLRDELIHELGRTGAFVRTLDERVLEEEVELAVHSMKDVPTDQPDDLVVVAVPERARSNDVLVTPEGEDLEDLPDGAVVGTSSSRRGAQLRAARPDLEIAPLRGNVDTRIEKLLAPHLQREHERRLEDEDDRFERDVETWFDDLAEVERRATEREVDRELDAIVLAEAGLQRSGLARQVSYRRLPVEDFTPAAGQGALAVTGLDTELTGDLHRALDHPPSRVEGTVERTVLATVGGGCIAPIGVHAILQGEHVHTTVQVLSADGTERIAETRDLPVETHARAARELGEDLRDRGADDLIAAAAEE